VKSVEAGLLWTLCYPFVRNAPEEKKLVSKKHIVSKDQDIYIKSSGRTMDEPSGPSVDSSMLVMAGLYDQSPQLVTFLFFERFKRSYVTRLT